MNARTRTLLALLALLALLVTACGGDAGGGGGEDGETEATGGSSETEGAAATGDLGLQQEGRILVGSDIAFEPFEFVEDGENKGFDVDLMNEIGKRLGIEVEFVNASFDTIFTQLAGGDFDAIISAITITDERKETIDFSDPYFAANQALAVGADSEIASVEDLDGAQVAVQAGTTGLDYAKENFETNGATIVEFPTSEAAFTALESGQVDAVFIDLPVVGARVESSDEVKLAQEVDTGELYGIGVQKGNEGLVSAINEQLSAIIADGTYEKLYTTWFEGDVPEQFAS